MLERTILPAVSAACLSAVLAVGATPLSAQQSGGPFAGKTVQMIIGFGPGGGYDRWGRVVARHIGRHLPGNPQVVPQNMPGAGSFIAANHIFNVAPKDGTVMGIIARDAPLGPLTGAEGARFDPLKLTWLGTPTTETNVCIAFHTAKVKSAKDLFTTEVILGDTGPGTGTHTYPIALGALLGMKFKLVSGFPSSADVFLAMERGEVDGICESLDSVIDKRPDWIETKKVLVLFQGGAAPNPELKGVPFILDFARNEEERQAMLFLYGGQGIGRPFVAPPDMPADRLKVVRDAFAKTMSDPEFIADVKKDKLDLKPLDGEHLAELIARMYQTPKAVVEKVSKLLKAK